ncbi:hypothetical protein [Pseudomonas sp. H1h]|uniref:hypothetical protein n=1 Tax=Pseudomonas sp. H1h TaxID=1397280 RepID=UPI0004692D0B|nr:hypothetical protein [Pseudomonas sp. H1h]
MKPEKLHNTRGNVQATIEDRDGKLAFIARTELEIRETAEQFRISATMRHDVQTFRVIELWFPNTLSNDGTENRFSLKPSPDSKTQGRYSYFPEGVSLGSYEGVLTVHYDWKTARMWGSFDYRVHSGPDEIISVSAGIFDLTGITVAHLAGKGTFEGTVDKENFKAVEVGIQHKEVDGKPYLEVVGRTHPPIGAEHITLIIDADLQGLTHPLGRSDSKVQALYFHSPFGFFYARSGEVTFASLPTQTHAKGTLTGAFQQNEEPPRKVNCTFDITETPTR